MRLPFWTFHAALVCVLTGGFAASFGLAALVARVRPIARIIGAGPPSAAL
jgi:hypothetical protein